jgi:hypothetical protein
MIMGLALEEVQRLAKALSAFSSKVRADGIVCEAKFAPIQKLKAILMFP